jgi:hypothetical protein
MNQLHTITRTFHILEENDIMLLLQVNIADPAKDFFLFVPFAAPGGTAEGSQRLYTELAFKLGKKGYNTVLMDLPPYGESCFSKQKETDDEFDLYRAFVTAGVQWIATTHGNPQLIICAMCFAALPVIQFAASSHIHKVVLLSPHNYAANWLQASEKIRTEIFSIKPLLLERNTPLNILVIQGQNDKQREAVNGFLEEHIYATGATATTACLIEQANYTFNGWAFKEAIFTNIYYWLNT